MLIALDQIVFKNLILVVVDDQDDHCNTSFAKLQHYSVVVVRSLYICLVCL